MCHQLVHQKEASHMTEDGIINNQMSHLEE